MGCFEGALLPLVRVGDEVRLIGPLSLLCQVADAVCPVRILVATQHRAFGESPVLPVELDPGVSSLDLLSAHAVPCWCSVHHRVGPCRCLPSFSPPVTCLWSSAGWLFRRSTALSLRGSLSISPRLAIGGSWILRGHWARGRVPTEPSLFP